MAQFLGQQADAQRELFAAAVLEAGATPDFLAFGVRISPLFLRCEPFWVSLFSTGNYKKH